MRGAGDVELAGVDGKKPQSHGFDQLGKEGGLASIDSLQDGEDLEKNDGDPAEKKPGGRRRYLCWFAGVIILKITIVSALAYFWVPITYRSIRMMPELGRGPL